MRGEPSYHLKSVLRTQKNGKDSTAKRFVSAVGGGPSQNPGPTTSSTSWGWSAHLCGARSFGSFLDHLRPLAMRPLCPSGKDETLLSTLRAVAGSWTSHDGPSVIGRLLCFPSQGHSGTTSHDNQLLGSSAFSQVKADNCTSSLTSLWLLLALTP